MLPEHDPTDNGVSHGARNLSNSAATDIPHAVHVVCVLAPRASLSTSRSGRSEASREPVEDDGGRDDEAASVQPRTTSGVIATHEAVLRRRSLR